MEIVKENDIIQIKENNSIVEEYKFDEEINFSGLIEYLLKLNLSRKIEIIDNIEEKKQEEENLIRLINNIIFDYNLKVTELDEFKNQYEDSTE